MDRDERAIRPPSINGWAPWVAVVIAVVVPTCAWLISMGQQRAQQEITQRISEANAAKLEKISEKVSEVGSDVAVIKVRIETLERSTTTRNVAEDKRNERERRR